MLDNYFGKNDVVHDFADTLNTINFVSEIPKPLQYGDRSYSLHITLDPSQALKDTLCSILIPKYVMGKETDLHNRIV